MSLAEKEQEILSFIQELELINSNLINLEAIASMRLQKSDFVIIRDIINFSQTTSEAEDILSIALIELFRKKLNGSVSLKLSTEQLPKGFAKETNKQKLSSYYLTNEEFLKKFTKQVEAGKYKEVLSTNPETFVPLLLIDGSLYLQKNYIAKTKLESDLKERLQGKTDLSKIEKAIKITTVINQEFTKKNSTGQQNISLNLQQKAAIVLSLINDFTIISGGPGTGKTTIIKSIIKANIDMGINPKEIRLIAPTGKAAQRISESIQDEIGMEASTIHRLLKYSPVKNRFTYGKINQLNLKLIIVDEVSMIDINLMNSLLEAINPTKTKIIFMGDKDQIPSVSEGQVLSDMIPESRQAEFSNGFFEFFKKGFADGFQKNKADEFSVSNKKLNYVDKLVILTTSYRSQAKTYELAQKINRSEKNIIAEIDSALNDKGEILWEKISKDKNNNCFFLDADSDNDYKTIRKTLRQWQAHYLDPLQEAMIKCQNIDFSSLEHGRMVVDDKGYEQIAKLFNLLNSSQIITFAHRNPFGSASINDYLQKRWDRTLADKGVTITAYPIIVNSNDHQLKIYNGNLGIVLNKRVVFRRGKEFISFAIELLHDYSPSFAITVHKSQGSEYQHILLVLPNNIDNPLLKKELLYTGLTRSSKTALIFGAKDVFEQAVSQGMNRYSGIFLFD